MGSSIRIPILSAVLCIMAASAGAQLTVVTDVPLYTQGDVVSITIHNAGPSQAHFNSFPACTIYHLGTMECVDGCTGLPELWNMGVGETIGHLHDTGAAPDQAGWYRVELTGGSVDPGSILHCDYQLLEIVPIGSGCWGAVKALYR